MAFDPNNELLEAMRSFTSLVQGGAAPVRPELLVMQPPTPTRQPAVGVTSAQYTQMYEAKYGRATATVSTVMRPESTALKTVAVVGALGLGLWLITR